MRIYRNSQTQNIGKHLWPFIWPNNLFYQERDVRNVNQPLREGVKKRAPPSLPHGNYNLIFQVFSMIRKRLPSPKSLHNSPSRRDILFAKIIKTCAKFWKFLFRIKSQFDRLGLDKQFGYLNAQQDIINVQSAVSRTAL